MKAEVWHTPRSKRHVLAISAWWRENRTASPDLFRRELEGAIDLLEQSPDIGRRYPDAKIPGLRRLLCHGPSSGSSMTFAQMLHKLVTGDA